MSEFGVDLSVWLENGRVRALLELVDQLPSVSRLAEARANDPEEAEQIALARMKSRGENEQKTWHPEMREYQLIHKQMGAMISLQQQMIKALTGGNGKVQPFPEPRTGVHEAMERIESEWTDNVLVAFGFDPTK